MKICLALILDNKMHNYARKIAFDIDKKYNTGFIAAKLPQHVTLGPLFEVESPESVEEYFDSLARAIKPFEVNVSNVDLKVLGSDEDGFGILWMVIKESNELRELHNKIYNDIKKYSWKADEVYDEGGYKFHSTISLGNQPPKVYKDIFSNIENKEINYNCKVKEIALFCPPDNENRMGTYISYKILPLQG